MTHRTSRALTVTSILVCSCMLACADDSSKSMCGNGVLDGGEMCDAAKMSQKASCPDGTHLPPGAFFSCNDDCTLNTDACVSDEANELCGNGELDEGEFCDGDLKIETASCPAGTYLPPNAKLLCKANCTLNTNSCVPDPSQELCGNGQLDAGEMCDGTLINESATCPQGIHLAEGKSFTCNPNCTLNTLFCESDGPDEPVVPQGVVANDKLTSIPIHRTPQYNYPDDTLKNEHDGELPQIVGYLDVGTNIDLLGIVGESSFLGGSYLIQFEDGKYYIHSNNVKLTNDAAIPRIDYSSASTPNYYQKDEKWKDVPYKSTTIGQHGGGAIAVANAIAMLKNDENITPETIANKLDLYQDLTNGHGTERAFVCPMIEGEYDLECEYIDTSKGLNYGTEESTNKNDAATRAAAKQKIEEAFKNGWYIVALEGGAAHYWTSDTSRHFITLYGYDKDNDIVYVDDPLNIHYMQQGIEDFLDYTHSIFVITNKPADKDCTPKTCADYAGKCGDNLNDGCGSKLNCTCEDGTVCVESACVMNKDVYPKRKSIKGIQPDAADTQKIIDSNVHGVVFNMVWGIVQESKKTECSSDEVKYKGYCYKTSKFALDKIKKYTDAGVVVTAIVYGVPDWAKVNCNTANVNGNSGWFCAPRIDAADDFGRYAGFLAWYFNGIEHDGNKGGRIADFVIHNEVNCSHWYNYGCTNVNDCKLDPWVENYAASWNKAYDYIREEQKQAKVLISFDHMFAHGIDVWRHKSVEDFILKLVPKLGDREWRLAFHSYPPDLGKPQFGADDWPIISFGNIGVLSGWLRQHYPDKPYAWEIQLTENGISGDPNKNQLNDQNSYLCKAFENCLGTPGVESFIYHRYEDVKAENLYLGLVNLDGQTPKPAWSTYVDANKPGAGKCGFQMLPYIELKRYFNGSVHWVTTRMPPGGFNYERSWKTYRDKPDFGDPIMLYECRVGGSDGSHTMVSTDVNCEGQFNMGPMGYAFKTQQKDTVPLYRCHTGGGSHFITDASNCEGQTKDMLVGYVYECKDCKH